LKTFCAPFPSFLEISDFTRSPSPPCARPSNTYLPTLDSMTGLTSIRKPLLTLIIIGLVAGAALSPKVHAYAVYYQLYNPSTTSSVPSGSPGGTVSIFANISAGSQYQIRVTQLTFTSSFQITGSFSPSLPVTVSQNGHSRIDITLQIPGNVAVGDYNVSSSAQWDAYLSTGWATQSPDCCVSFKMTIQQLGTGPTSGTGSGGSGGGSGGGGTDLAQTIGYGAGAAILIIGVAFYLGRRRRTVPTMIPPAAPEIGLPAAPAYCSNCGSQLTLGAPFCHQCGTPAQ
jgi:zinc ribbon protein